MINRVLLWFFHYLSITYPLHFLKNLLKFSTLSYLKKNTEATTISTVSTLLLHDYNHVLITCHHLPHLPHANWRLQGEIKIMLQEETPPVTACATITTIIDIIFFHHKKRWWSLVWKYEETHHHHGLFPPIAESCTSEEAPTHTEQKQ